MPTKPIFEKLFSRDFTLITAEVWGRAEALDYTQWGIGVMPFFPYFVLERKNGIVSGFYRPEAIDWIKRKFIEEAKNDKNFLKNLLITARREYDLIEIFFRKQKGLPKKKFVEFLEHYERSWTWLVGMWWLWEMRDEEFGDVSLPEGFRKERNRTQNYVPNCEIVVRESLDRFYPDIKKFHDVLRLGEMVNDNVPLKRELQKRLNGYYWVKGDFHVGVSRNFIEKKYNLAFETIKPGTKKELSGAVACGGKIRGVVKIVYGARQMDKVGRGDIIVAPMTLPDILPAMKLAAGFVTDEGGIACHAAIIAREFNKPCIIGTKIATKVLHDGQLVEVDANKGVVKILKKV